MRLRQHGTKATTPKRKSRTTESTANMRLTLSQNCRLANKLYLKVADLAAEDGDYAKAIENYEKISNSSMNNNLMKWSVKDYLLKAGICHLATNVNLALICIHSHVDIVIGLGGNKKSSWCVH